MWRDFFQGEQVATTSTSLKPLARLHRSFLSEFVYGRSTAACHA
jgi:hypothetical protein